LDDKEDTSSKDDAGVHTIVPSNTNTAQQIVDIVEVEDTIELLSGDSEHPNIIIRKRAQARIRLLKETLDKLRK
jgi:hypothetical protein